MNTTISQLLAELKSAHTLFINTAQQLDPAKRSRAGVCGVWSPKDVTAHLTGWDQLLNTFINDPVNFSPPQDVHQFNELSVQKRRDHNWDEIMAECQTNFSQLEESLATVTAEMKMFPRVTGWLPGRIADYKLHQQQLAEWLP
ncbi:MAG: ClbS/DfsB family four-helix bundle protein [Ardenticatenaceae bacterium]|nr:ClbS/DfsB family four-helix bundle protein [Ardenticatenaceae bacterium]